MLSSRIPRICSIAPRLLPQLRTQLPTRVAPLSTTPVLSATAAWKKMLIHNPAFKEDDVAEGEKYFWLDRSMLKDRFPTLETMNELFDGVPYKDLPIVTMRSTKNNTMISCGIRPRYSTMCITSGGREGFKTCRKGTSVAAQAVGISIGLKLRRRGIKTVRLCIQGFGAGRMSAVEGMCMAGLNIVSVTDKSDLREFGPRPKKARRL